MSPVVYGMCQAFLYFFFRIWNRLVVFGSENLPSARRGYILASNHVSYLDPPVLGAGIKRPVVFLAREKLFRFFFLGRLMRLLGVLPIAGDTDFRAIRSVIRRLRRGDAVAIFPEGTRSWDGKPSMEGKNGVAFMAVAAKVPIIPCFVQGTEQAMGRGSVFIKPKKIRVFLDRPYEVLESGREKSRHYEDVTLDVMKRIQRLRDLASAEQHKGQ